MNSSKFSELSRAYFPSKGGAMASGDEWGGVDVWNTLALGSAGTEWPEAAAPSGLCSW